MALQLATMSGLVPYQVEQNIRALATETDRLDAEIASVAKKQQAPLTIDQIRRALGATGGSPLNIFTLLGSSSGGLVQMGTHAQRIALNPASLPSGSIFWETDRTAAYMVIAGQWWFVVGTPFAGTLSPNQKPSDLGTRDAGFEFRSTDFDRLYRWTGSAWIDAPGQEARGQIAFFPITIDAAFTPGTGWQLCDGTAGVTISKADGTTGTVTVPDLTTASRFLRSVSGATGGTGGSATTHTHQVDPPNTTSGSPSVTATGAPSATVEVQAGVGTTVATDTHTHNHDHTHDVNIAAFASAGPSGSGGDDALPPYYNARPYIRL